MGSWTETATAKALALAAATALAPIGLAPLLPFAAFALTPSAPAGELTLDEPLALSTTVLGGGETLTGRVTYRNRTSQPITISRLAVAVRPPGATNAATALHGLDAKPGPDSPGSPGSVRGPGEAGSRDDILTRLRRVTTSQRG